MSARTLWTPRVVGMMLCTLIALYLALLAFIALSDDRLIATATAMTVAIVAVMAFEASLPQEIGILRSFQANATLWILFVIVFVLDAIVIHPGLAKDVEPTAAGIVEYALRLLGLVALPGAVAGVGLHFCVGALRHRRRTT